MRRLAVLVLSTSIALQQTVAALIANGISANGFRSWGCLDHSKAVVG